MYIYIYHMQTERENVCTFENNSQVHVVVGAVKLFPSFPELVQLIPYHLQKHGWCHSTIPKLPCGDQQ